MTESERLFEQVYRTYGPSLYRFCLLQMKNPADAEDVLQEVFCKRLYRAPAFTSPDHERRWLFRVALNQCRDAWKRSSRSDLPLEAASAAVTPEELGLLDHVAALPEPQRTAIHLHYYEGERTSKKNGSPQKRNFPRGVSQKKHSSESIFQEGTIGGFYEKYFKESILKRNISKKKGLVFLPHS